MYAQMLPVQNAENQTGWALITYLGALGQMLQDLDYLAHAPDAQHPVWFNLIDLDAVPDNGVPWLGQFIGIHAQPGLTPAQQRQQLRDRVGWQRGTPAAVSAAIALFLTGTKTVQMNERDSSPYHFTATIWANELTPNTATQVTNYVNQFAKPAGLQWTLTVNPGSPPAVTYAQIYTRGDTYGSIYTSFQTYADIH
jgi:hypothetical protein